MMRQLTLPTLICFGSLFLLTGCPDPDVEFADFTERYEDIHGSGSGGMAGVGGGCAVPSMGELDGEYFFALAPPQSAKKPAPFTATLAVNGATFTLSLQPLDAEDRVTAIGSAIDLGPFDLADDATFEADLGTIIIPSETNPLTTSELTGEVQLAGALCPADYLCGPATGSITMPVMLPIDGAFWTMESMDTFAEPPKVDCSGGTADPL